MRLVKAVQMLKGLANRNRLRILNLLSVRELTGTQLSDVLRLPRSTVARHLRYLYRSQLVVPRHAANEAYYAVREDNDPDARRLVEAVLYAAVRIEGVDKDRRRLETSR